MKVYNPHGKGRTQTVLFAPGVDYPENSDWMYTERREDGQHFKKARSFQAVFKDGVAEVESTLGKYMLEKGLAQRSNLLVPDGVRA